MAVLLNLSLGVEMKPSKEIAELRECIEVIDFNLTTGKHDPIQQATLRDVHMARIRELENGIPRIVHMIALGCFCAIVAAGIIGYIVGLNVPRDLTIGEKICANYDAKHGYGVKK